MKYLLQPESALTCFLPSSLDEKINNHSCVCVLSMELIKSKCQVFSLNLHKDWRQARLALYKIQRQVCKHLKISLISALYLIRLHHITVLWFLKRTPCCSYFPTKQQFIHLPSARVQPLSGCGVDCHTQSVSTGFWFWWKAIMAPVLAAWLWWGLWEAVQNPFQCLIPHKNIVLWECVWVLGLNKDDKMSKLVHCGCGGRDIFCRHTCRLVFMLKLAWTNSLPTHLRLIQLFHLTLETWQTVMFSPNFSFNDMFVVVFQTITHTALLYWIKLNGVVVYLSLYKNSYSVNNRLFYSQVRIVKE